MPDLSVASCVDYAPEHCQAALQAVLAPLGGLDWVHPGMRIGIKANLVSMLRPERAGTTHPALLAALSAQLRARGAEVVIGDSPGGLYNYTYVNRIYTATGMRTIADVQLNEDFSVKTAQMPQAWRAKTFSYTGYLDQCDAIINFCKLKTHGMMGMSAAAKNLFGVVPGTMKPEYHFRYPDPMDFAHMIVDLDEYFCPRLNLVDAVVGMEGNGPTSGTPRQVGCLVAGTSAHAVDLLCAALIGLPVDRIPTLRAAQERLLIPDSVETLEIAGDWRRFLIPDYKLLPGNKDTKFAGTGGVFGRIRSWLMQQAVGAEPVLKKHGCVGCAVCKKVCPAAAIQMEQKRPKIDRRKCIRCFCCQEFCPEGALEVRRKPIARLLAREEV